MRLRGARPLRNTGRNRGTMPRFQAFGGGASRGSFSLTNLQAAWKLNEASGAQRDDSHGTNHLTNNGTVGQAAGKLTNAASFDNNAANYLSIADNAALSMGNIDFTVVAWIFLTGSGMAQAIVAKGDTSGLFAVEYMLSLNANGNPNVLFRVDNGSSSGATVTSTSTILLNSWVFLVAWHDATADTLNVQVNDGAVDSAAYSAGSFDGTNAMHLGGVLEVGVNSLPFTGRIDESSIWKRVLTSAERTSLYNAGAGISYPFI